MNTKEIDRVLRDERTIQPTPEFASRVMGAVRREAQDPGSISFPWARALSGAIACLVLTVVTLILVEPQPLSEATLKKLQDPRILQAVTWGPLLVLGTWMMILAALRFAGLRR